MSNPTNVFGTITDPNGLPYYPATVTAALNPGTINPTVNGQAVNPNPGSNYTVGPVQTAADGSFSMGLFANSVISPGGTTWALIVYAPGSAPPAGLGIINFAVVVTISGSSQNVSSALSDAAPELLPSGGGGGGTVTNTGDLATGHIVVGNDGVDVETNDFWTLDNQLLAQDDSAGIFIKSTDATLDVTISPTSIGVESLTNNVYVTADAVDLSSGTPDIIDSTGAHGTSGQVLSSLGSGLGVKWVTL